MMDDPVVLDRQSAYLDHIRALGRPERLAGLVACLLGVLMIVMARFRLGGNPWLLWGGVAVVACGWGLFAYSVFRRVAWVRAHPFDVNG